MGEETLRNSETITTLYPAKPCRKQNMVCQLYHQRAIREPGLHIVTKVTMKKHRVHWDSGIWDTVTIWNFQHCLTGYIELTFLMVSEETMSRMMIWFSLASQTRRYHCGATLLVRRSHQFRYQQRSTEEPEPPDPFGSEAASVLW